MRFGCGLVFSDVNNTGFLSSVSEVDYTSMKQSMKVKIAEAIGNKKL